MTGQRHVGVDSVKEFTGHWLAAGEQLTTAAVLQGSRGHASRLDQTVRILRAIWWRLPFEKVTGVCSGELLCDGKHRRTSEMGLPITR
jgi:hypothetical protein